MAQPTSEFYLIDNPDFTLSSAFIQPSSPIDEISDPIRYDYSTTESFDGLDLADLYPSCSNQDSDDLINIFHTNEEFVALSPTTNEINELLADGLQEVHSTETNDMADPIQSTDEHLAMIKSSDPSLPVIRSHIGKPTVKSPHDQSISLSDSVAVTVPTPHLHLVYGLEDTYRARYKSDYFPQKGNARRPRYVADSKGHHYVTLQLPAGYTRDLKNEYVRIGLLTTSIENCGHFYSPYKFQIDHHDAKIPDQNPMYLPVQGHRESGSNLKFHLVLIKSKLDQLNDAQPLKPFIDTIGSVQNIISEEKLSPKELINRYQLDKSHIVFTLCTKLADDRYQVHHETTVVSSVITELPAKPVGTSKSRPEANPASTGKRISCPNCAHCFDISDGQMTEKGNKRTSTARASRTSTKSATSTRTNKKKKTA